ncbi:hypothetical protein [Bradyrhizobium sp. CCBAU 53415]|uniref:hypothetical protein n=1 Tax=Bradyrhizobium sp. CCBAU 53415 TaxID=1325119 RepID=UPI0023057D3C|nr:hypothetical protein [Bradyrhizobium sp. CCBAU 53415]MDA9469205.1 hypothetical protein [Bradyrhizobium sp. CCBAU 53415]
MNIQNERAPSDAVYLWAAGALALVASAPTLFARQIFGDDWTVYYIYWTEGAASVARLMWQAAHGGYAIPMELFVALGSDTPSLVARITGLTCHLLSGLLLYRALGLSAYTRPVAALTAALFLLTPFYVIRLTFNAIYDFFLVFYLLSLVLMEARSRTLRWIAPLCLFFSLSLETLIALEPLRLLIAWRAGERWTAWFARLVPFWLMILAVVVLRVTIMGKSGHYAEQYAPVHDINVIAAAFLTHLRAFPRALAFAFDYAAAMFGRGIFAALILTVIAVGALFGERLSRSKWPLTSARSVLLLLLGATITVLGAVPYALVGIYGDVTRGESRLLFPSQFGVLLLLATAIQLVPSARLRAAVAGSVIAVFALSMAHDSKWLLYDGLVTTDLTRQVRAALLADPEPKVVEIKIIPASWTLLFRQRCLGAADMNAAQMILRDGQRQPSFAYTDNCGDFTNPAFVPAGRCPVSYIDDSQHCPARRETWQYQATPGIPPLDEMGLLELLASERSTASSSTGGRGQLTRTADGRQVPLPRSEYRPPCGRAGVRPLLWLLAMPAPGCD